jgi:hypothetical protein
MADSAELTTCLKELLGSFRSPIPVRCSKCKVLMEYMPAAFFYDGTAWEVPLHFCPQCCASTSANNLWFLSGLEAGERVPAPRLEIKSPT